MSGFLKSISFFPSICHWQIEPSLNEPFLIGWGPSFLLLNHLFFEERNWSLFYSIHDLIKISIIINRYTTWSNNSIYNQSINHIRFLSIDISIEQWVIQGDDWLLPLMRSSSHLSPLSRSPGRWSAPPEWLSLSSSRDSSPDGLLLPEYSIF